MFLSPKKKKKKKKREVPKHYSSPVIPCTGGPSKSSQPFIRPARVRATLDEAQGFLQRNIPESRLAQKSAVNYYYYYFKREKQNLLIDIFCDFNLFIFLICPYKRTEMKNLVRKR
jgi:hypothetical protein